MYFIRLAIIAPRWEFINSYGFFLKKNPSSLYKDPRRFNKIMVQTAIDPTQNIPNSSPK
jgi:hypothetical protein